MKITYMKTLIAIGVLGGVMTGLTSCANNAPAAEDQMKALQKQVIQLKAENSHLQAKSRKLDDKVLLYEKKDTLVQKKEQQAKQRTVRLTPTTNSMPQLPYESYDEDVVVSLKGDSNKDEKRPVLRLSESSFSEYHISNGASETPKPSRLPTKSYENLPLTNKGDNLGVVGADGQMARAEEDSMELFNSAYRAYNNKGYGPAIAGFSTFLQKESNHKFADNAMFWIAECYLAQGQMLKAVGEFERLLRRYPSSEKAASSLYRIGFVYDRMQDTSKAKEYYFRVVEKHPESEAARKASRRMSENKGNARLIRTSAKR